MPADHYIENPNAFLDAVEAGVQAANNGFLVTFGVKPTRPETGYGYVKTGNPLVGAKAFAVDRFVEKPDRQTAARFCEASDYFWNSGIFLFGAQAFLNELSRFEPEMVRQSLAAVEGAASDLNFIRLGQSFADCKSNSIDYAVMEKTEKAALVPLDAGWSDVGTWDALFEAGDKDESQNVARGDVVFRNANNCYVRAEYGMVAVSNVDDIIVVSTKDATLITKRDESGSVKDVVQHLAAHSRNEAEHHLAVHRPWGHYETLHLSERYQVKQIVVEPGAAPLAATPSSSRRTLDRRQRHRARHHRQRSEASKREPINLCARLAPCIGWKIRASFRSRSLRCSRGPISARTTSFAWKTFIRGRKLSAHTRLLLTPKTTKTSQLCNNFR